MFLQGKRNSHKKALTKRQDNTKTLGRYNLTSDHDPDWVQRQLNIAAPKLRSQFALKASTWGDEQKVPFLVVPGTCWCIVSALFVWFLTLLVVPGTAGPTGALFFFVFNENQTYLPGWIDSTFSAGEHGPDPEHQVCSLHRVPGLGEIWLGDQKGSLIKSTPQNLQIFWIFLVIRRLI